MAQIMVDVAGKQYPLACADGGEDHLRELVTYVDNKAKELTGKLGKISESRLLLMVAVVIADELQDSAAAGGHTGPLSGMAEEEVAAIINKIAGNVEVIAEDLAKV